MKFRQSKRVIKEEKEVNFKELEKLVDKLNSTNAYKWKMAEFKEGDWTLYYSDARKAFILSYKNKIDNVCVTRNFKDFIFTFNNSFSDDELKEIQKILKGVNYPITESKRKLKESFMDEYVPATVNDNLSVEEYFGTLMQSVVETWGLHLNTNKYSEHIALNELYDNLLESVDALIENYKGIYGNIPAKPNVFKPEATSAAEYLIEFREFVENGRSLFTDSEILSDIDSILSAIDETLYKVENLTESRKRNRKSVNNILKEKHEDDSIHSMYYHTLLNMYEEFKDEIFNEYNSKEFGYYELRDFINKKILKITDKRKTKKLDEVTRYCISLWKIKKWINDLYEESEYDTYEFLK